MIDDIMDSGRWGITYLQTDSRLNEEERSKLMWIATEMYLKEEKKRNVEGKRYEGRITTNGQYALLGAGFGGQKFEATLDADFGKAELSFLVTEKIKVGLN